MSGVLGFNLGVHFQILNESASCFPVPEYNLWLGCKGGFYCAVNDDFETPQFCLLYNTVWPFCFFAPFQTMCSRFSLHSTSFRLPFLQPLGWWGYGEGRKFD